MAAQRGDLTAVKQILDEINSQMVGSSSGEEFDLEVAEIRASVVNEVNELGPKIYSSIQDIHRYTNSCSKILGDPTGKK